MSNTTLKHQLIFYFICGAISTSFDFIIYFSLHKYGIQTDLAKGTSFLIATFISYFLNKHITFKMKEKSFYEFLGFVVVHVIAMLCDVITNKIMLIIIGLFITGHQQIVLAFICATGASVIVNFIGQRYWVFRRPQINLGRV